MVLEVFNHTKYFKVEVLWWKPRKASLMKYSKFLKTRTFQITGLFLLFILVQNIVQKYVEMYTMQWECETYSLWELENQTNERSLEII